MVCVLWTSNPTGPRDLRANQGIAKLAGTPRSNRRHSTRSDSIGISKVRKVRKTSASMDKSENP